MAKDLICNGWIFLIFFFICLSIASVCGGQEIILPSELFFYSPVASTSGQSSIWSNPAALGNRQMGTLFMFSHRDDRIIRDWGTASTTRAMGAAYRFIQGGILPDHKEYIVAFGGGRRLSFGFSYRYISEGAQHLRKRHLWNIGLLMRRSKNISLGARVDNINRGKIESKKSDMRLVYGIAARTYRDLVTVSFDVDMTSRESIRQADFRTGIELRPKAGLYIYADMDNHSNFGVGFRMNLRSNYAGHYSSFDRDAKNINATTYLGAVKGRQPSFIKLQKKTLVVNLDGTLPENPPIPFWGHRSLKFIDYINAIYKAADDDEIGDLYLNIKNLRCGPGKTEELSEAVDYFRQSGKSVYSYLHNSNNIGYLLACAADTVIIPPVSQLQLLGLNANIMMYKGLMDRLGIEAEFERIDEYKSYPEVFMFERPSEAYRDQVNRLLENIYREMVAEISTNRSLDSDSVKALIDVGPLTSIEAVDYGLCDERLYADEAMEKYAGSNCKFISKRISINDYVNLDRMDDYWGQRPQIGVIIAEGDILPGNDGKIGQYEMLTAIRLAAENSNIKGVALRINSPGGDALASDLIWHELDKTSRRKPIVVSMSNVAASGGYYIASVNSKIFINRNTITGSIGVFGGKINIAGLYDKLDLYSESITRGKNAGMFSLSKPFTPEQRLVMKDHLRAMYNNFLDKVSTARGMASDSVNSLGRGQTWTGREAVENGLADNLGGIDAAIAEICKKAQLNRNDIELVYLPQKRYFFKNPFYFSGFASRISKMLGGDSGVKEIFQNPYDSHVYYRMPYELEFE
ncbi:MAG: signal peptide peptidase SppA [Candidatus Zixiibacteriota bacterium]